MKKNAASVWSDLKLRPYAWLLPLIAVICIAGALLRYEYDYLFRVQEYNLFLYTPLFFKQQLVVAGGLLRWVGAYFTQFFYHPWIGLTLLCLWWLLLTWLTRRAFRIANQWTAVLLIPIALLLLIIVDMGYFLYFFKMRGFAFNATIGTTVAVALTWAYRSLPKRWYLRTFFILLAAIIAYPALGFYGLMGILMMGLLAWRLDDYSRLHKMIDTAVAVIAIVVVPLLYYQYCYYETNITDIYRIGIPLYIVGEEFYAYYLPYALLVLFYAVVALVPLRGKDIRRTTLWMAGNAVFIGLLAYATWHFWYKDANYHTELRMYHAAERQEWENVLTEMRLSKDEPTRFMWLMKNLALFHLGRQGNEMYHYRNGSKHANAPFNIHMLQIGGKIFYLHYGQQNYCNRWCLEDGVEYGWSIEVYKYLLRCAVLNGEFAVAQKYIDILSTTKYYKEWAEHYEPFLHNPSLMDKDPELRINRHFKDMSNQLTSDQTLVEVFLQNIFLTEDSKDIVHKEMNLLQSMEKKDIQLFWPRFFSFAQNYNGNGKSLPRHYQEAAYLYGNLEHEIDISNMPFDPEVVNTYNEFMGTAKQLSNLPEGQMKEAMKDRFGNTFFFDYFFTHGMKTY